MNPKAPTAPQAPRPAGARLSLGLVAAAGVGWATSLMLMRLGIDAGIPYLGMAFWPNLGSGLMLGLYLLIRFRPIPLGARHLRFYAICGLLGNALPAIAIVFVAPRIPVGVLAMDMALEPAFTYLFALALALERFHKLRLAGLALGLGGLMLIILPEAGLPTPDMAPWVLLGLSAPISWALLSVWFARARPPETGVVTLVCGLCVTSALMTLPLMAATGDWWWFDTPFGVAEWSVVGLSVAIALSWIIAFECIRLAGPVLYAAWGYVAAPTGIGYGLVLFGERNSGWIWGALAAILLGLFLLNRTSAAAHRAPARR